MQRHREASDRIIEDYGLNGCHVIVQTPDAQMREAISRWLDSEGLTPRQVWSVHQMTSFAVSEPDEERIRTLFNGLYARLLVKVIPPGQTDERIRRLTVVDGQNQELVVPQVPVQLTVADLGAIAARFHPAEASTSTRPAGRRRSGLATHTGNGITQDVPMDATLLQSGFSDNHRVVIRSVSFHQIRVVFVGASPRFNGDNQLAEVRFSKELARLRDKARMGHIRLAGEFPHATQDYLAEIMQRQPDILHIACHGRGQELLWEDDDGDADAVPAALLAENIADRAQRQLSGIVLTACDGASAGPLFTCAARDVIAHEGALSSNKAIAFTTRFYDELALMPVLRVAARRADPSVLIFPLDGQGGR
jgi:hypothetical protein